MRKYHLEKLRRKLYSESTAGIGKFLNFGFEARQERVIDIIHYFAQDILSKTSFANKNHHHTTGNYSMAEFKHKMGSLVRVHGLKNAAYNGRLGQVVDVSELDTTGRLLVLLRDQVRPPLLQEIKIKPENMLTACSHCHKAGDKKQFCSKCRVAG